MTDLMVILGKPLPEDLQATISLITQLTGQIEYELTLVMKRVSPKMSLDEAYDRARELWDRGSLQDEVRKKFEIWAVDQKKEGELYQVLQRLDEIAKRRGRVTHDCWAYFRDDPNKVCRISFGEYVPVDVSELDRLARDMMQVIVDLTELSGHSEFVLVDGGPASPMVVASSAPSFMPSAVWGTLATGPAREEDNDEQGS